MLRATIKTTLCIRIDQREGYIWKLRIKMEKREYLFEVLTLLSLTQNNY
jgi:hypothetical protein